MAGRYDRWHHLRIEGDRDLAVRHLPEARKLLGQVAEQARVLGRIPQFARRLRLLDGTLLEASYKLGMPIVSITAPGAKAPGAAIVIPLRGFVLWPKNTGLPDGVDDDNPQTVATPPSQDAPAWAAWFFGAFADGWPDVTVRKRTYEDQYPNGLKGFGNIDWRGHNGESVNWRGRYARYWGSFLPGEQAYRYVWTQGQILLHGVDYATANPGEPKLAWGIFGACLREIDGQWFLFVIHQSTTSVALIRYEVDRHEETQEFGDWTIGGFLVVWTGTVNPVPFGWFFNASGTEASAVARGAVDGFGISTAPDYLYTLTVEEASASLASTALDALQWGIWQRVPDSSPDTVAIGGAAQFDDEDCECSGPNYQGPPNSLFDACIGAPMSPIYDCDSASFLATSGLSSEVYVPYDVPDLPQESICAVDYDGDRRVFGLIRVTELLVDGINATEYAPETASGSAGYVTCGETTACRWKTLSFDTTVTIHAPLRSRTRLELVLDGVPILLQEYTRDTTSTTIRQISINYAFDCETSDPGVTIDEHATFNRRSTDAVGEKAVVMYADLRRRMASLVRYTATLDAPLVVEQQYPCSGDGVFPGWTNTITYTVRGEVFVDGDTYYAGVVTTWNGGAETTPPEPITAVFCDLTSSFVDLPAPTTPAMETGLDIMWRFGLVENLIDHDSGEWNVQLVDDEDGHPHLGCWLWLEDSVLWSQSMIGGAPDEFFNGITRAGAAPGVNFADLTGVNELSAGAHYWPGWVLTRAI